MMTDVLPARKKQVRFGGVRMTAPASSKEAPKSTVDDSMDAYVQMLGPRFTIDTVILATKHGYIFRVVDTTTQTIKVAKCTLRGGDKDAWSAINNECELWPLIPEHENICRVEEIIFHRVGKALIMPYMKYDMHTVLSTRSGLSILATQNIMHQILSAIGACHDMNVYHRDIKPENLLVDSLDLELAHVYVCDFGLASLPTKTILHARVGTKRYMAPELLKDFETSYNGAKVDIWSLGVLFWNILTNSMPWNQAIMKCAQFRTFVSDQNKYFKWIQGFIPTEIPKSGIDLFKWMCHPVPSQRPTCAECLAHPFFTKVWAYAPPTERKDSNTSSSTETSEKDEIDVHHVTEMCQKMTFNKVN